MEVDDGGVGGGGGSGGSGKKMEHGAVQEDSEEEDRKDKLKLAGRIGEKIVERMRKDARNLFRRISASCIQGFDGTSLQEYDIDDRVAAAVVATSSATSLVGAATRHAPRKVVSLAMTTFQASLKRNRSMSAVYVYRKSSRSPAQLPFRLIRVIGRLVSRSFNSLCSKDPPVKNFCV